MVNHVSGIEAWNVAFGVAARARLTFLPMGSAPIVISAEDRA